MSIKNENNNNGAKSQPLVLVWDVRGAAEKLSVAIPTIRKWVRQGRLRRIKGCRKLLLPDEALREFVATAE